MARLGVVMTRLRDRRGLTQRDLAKRVGVSGAYVAMLEMGVRRNPSLAVLQRLAKALRVPVSVLLGESSEEGGVPLTA
jgi:transcriptional regulator with XRE-family HTH domain